MIATLFVIDSNSTSLSGTIGGGTAKLSITTDDKSWQLDVENLGTDSEAIIIQ